MHDSERKDQRRQTMDTNERKKKKKTLDNKMGGYKTTKRKPKKKGRDVREDPNDEVVKERSRIDGDKTEGEIFVV